MDFEADSSAALVAVRGRRWSVGTYADSPSCVAIASGVPMKRPMREPVTSRSYPERAARPLRCRVPRLGAVGGGNCSSTWLGGAGGG